MLMMSKCAPLVGFEQGGGGPNIANLFATTLYTGNNSARSITTGVDLAGLGGLLWFKCRSFAAGSLLFDTVRGAASFVNSSNTNAQSASGAGDRLTSFNSNGFSLGTDPGFTVNASLETYVAWSFARAARFFDVVTWTGNGTAGRTVSHGLGSAPGMIIIKETSSGGDNWVVFHRSLGNTKYLFLNTTAAEGTSAFIWASTDPTSTEFTIGSSSSINENGQTYIAYLFAHDTAADGVVQCGSYTGNGSSSGPVVTLGWQPQFVMIKCVTSGQAEDWIMIDAVRGMGSGSNPFLRANTSDAENSTDYLDVTSTGFQLKSVSNAVNGFPEGGPGNNYIYLAIRAAA